MTARGWIDVTRVLTADVPVWPGAPSLVLHRRLAIERGDGVNDSNLSCNVHAGTHVDAPCHVLAHAGGVESLPIDALIGPAIVLDCGECREIRAGWLEARLGPCDRRVLLRTQESKRWRAGERGFREDFAALSPDAAQWLAGRGTALVGIDSMSIQLFGNDSSTHEYLFAAGVVIVEGLDLSDAPAGACELICLPIPLCDSDGAPARVLIRPIEMDRCDR
jgi:arylformamidase